MRSRLLISVFLLIGIVFIFAAVQADSTTEVRSGTVTSVQGNHVVIKMSTGEEKEFDVPDDFRLTVDGKEISVHELKPGTHLSRTITTTTEPKTVYTTTVKNGTIWHAQGDTVIITGADGKNRQYNNVPDWIKFTVDGKDMDVMELKKGMRVTATIVSETPSTIVTSTPGGVSGNAPAAPAAAPAPAAEPAPAAAEPTPAPEKKTLPKTASNVDLLALLGVGLLLLSWKLR